jgi:hypothetical protein
MEKSYIIEDLIIDHVWGVTSNSKALFPHKYQSTSTLI